MPPMAVADPDAGRPPVYLENSEEPRETGELLVNQSST